MGGNGPNSKEVQEVGAPTWRMASASQAWVNSKAISNLVSETRCSSHVEVFGDTMSKGRSTREGS